MRRRDAWPRALATAAWLGLLAWLIGCAARWSPPPTATPFPTPRPRIAVERASTEQARVAIVAVPGITPAAVTEVLDARPSLAPTVQRLLKRGRAAELVPVQPPLPTPGLASLATGALPAEHKALSQALDVGVLGTPPLWQRAEEADRLAAVIGWPHATDPPQPGIWVAQTGTFAEAARHAVPLRPLGQPWPGAPSSLTPPREGRISLRLNEREVGVVWVLALDTQDDDRAAYDTFILDLDRRVGPESAFLGTALERRWASLRVAEDAGADFKLLEVLTDTLVLYQSPAPRFRAKPPELEAALWDRLGFFPPDADAEAYAQGWIDSEDLLRMAARQTEWLAQVSALVARTYAPDLLMTRWPVVAQVTPPTLLVDPAQPGWQPQRQNDLADVRRRAYATADQALFTLAQALDLSRTALFVASPHGYAPVHTEVNLLALLAKWGLMPFSPEGEPLWAEAPVRVVVEEGIAWLWPSPAVESPADVRATLKENLTALTDPATGQPPVATLLSDEALAQTALWTLSTREALFVQLRPGYRFVLAADEEIFRHTRRYGAAGYPPETPEMAGWVLAAGYGIVPGRTGERVSVVDVPATAARLLGLEWPPLLHGTPLDEWVQLP